MIATRGHISVLGLALIGAGIAFLLAYRLTFAATWLPHGGNASGVPYDTGVWQESKNYTSYSSEHSSAITGWYFKTYPDVYISTWQSGDPLHQYMVYTASQDDTDLATWFGVNSCEWYTETYSSAYNVRAFMYGHTAFNGDQQFTVICLNVSAYGDFPYTFDVGISQATRIRGIQHEIGHSLHLADQAGEGIMDTCWCRDIHQNEVNFVKFGYAVGH